MWRRGKHSTHDGASAQLACSRSSRRGTSGQQHHHHHEISRATANRALVLHLVEAPFVANQELLAVTWLALKELLTTRPGAPGGP